MNGKPKTQHRLIQLQPGFFQFKYLCEGDGERPTVALGYAPGSACANVNLMGPKKAGQVVLDTYGDMAVAFVEGSEATVAINLFIPYGFPDRSVRIEIERLEARPAAEQKNAVRDPPSLVVLSGHVERVGDTEASEDGWLGDPRGKHRIEGFSLQWPGRPFGVDVAYCCEIAGLGQTPTSLTGSFVGTRRRATPIRAVSFELYGENSINYELNVLTVFAKAGKKEGLSPGLVAGAGPDDYLVALRVQVVPRSGPQGASVASSPMVRTFTASDLSAE